MKLDKEKIELLQVVLTGTGDDGESVEFAEGNGFEKGLSYGVYPSKIYRYENKTEEDIESKRISAEGLLKAIEGKEVRGRYFLGWDDQKQNYRYYDTWDELAKAMGVSQMVTLTTKIPKNVAKRFTVFANEDSSISETLRKLVYGYVQKYMADNSEKLMFRETL